MHKLNINYILHNEATLAPDNTYDDSVNWNSDTSCIWCDLTNICPYSDKDTLKEKRSCFVHMGDAYKELFKVFLLIDSDISANRLCCFYTGRVYD